MQQRGSALRGKAAGSASAAKYVWQSSAQQKACGRQCARQALEATARTAQAQAVCVRKKCGRCAAAAMQAKCSAAARSSKARAHAMRQRGRWQRRRAAGRQAHNVTSAANQCVRASAGGRQQQQACKGGVGWQAGISRQGTGKARQAGGRWGGCKSQGQRGGAGRQVRVWAGRCGR